MIAYERIDVRIGFGARMGHVINFREGLRQFVDFFPEVHNGKESSAALNAFVAKRLPDEEAAVVENGQGIKMSAKCRLRRVVSRVEAQYFERNLE